MKLKIGNQKKIKEYYNNGKLEFEGKYFNGKRKNGKEFHYNGNLKFEGNYINGIRKKGKEYYYNGDIKFEGEYKNGKIWNGNLKENLPYNKEKYNVYEIRNGEKDGKAIEYGYSGVIEFEGEYKNSHRWNGKGIKIAHMFPPCNSYVCEIEYINGKEIILNIN